MATKLNAAFVERVTQIEPPTKDKTYYDVVLPRFLLRVRPSRKEGALCAAGYYVKYRTATGQSRKIWVGNPLTMSIDAARAAARKTLGQVDIGGDPAKERASEREAWTVGDAVAAYRASRDFTRKTPFVQYNDGCTFDNHILHHLASTKLADIDVSALKRFMHKVETDPRVGKRKRRLGGDGIARKAARMLSVVLSWAVLESKLASNPLKGNMKLRGDGTRDTIIAAPEEYARLFTAMDELIVAGKPPLRPFTRAFIVIAALTGMRRSELQKLRWGNVDLDNQRLTLHDTKGAKLARSGPKTENVSLPWRAVMALASIKPDDALPHELVFVPLQGKHIAVNIDWRRIRKVAGLPADLTLHGLRHSVGTAAIVAGLSLPETQKLLRHRNPSTTSRYIHLAEQHQARLQERAMAHLDPEPERPAVPLRLIPKIT